MNGAIGQVSAAASGIAIAVGEQQESAEEIDAGTSRAVGAAEDIGRRIGGVADAVSSASSLSAAVRSSVSNLAVSARDLSASTDMFVSFLQLEEAVAA